MSLLLAYALAVAAADEPHALLRFTKLRSREAPETTVEIGELKSSGAQYWLRRTVDHRVAMWTDTKRCPAARSVVEQAAKLPLPKLWLPETTVAEDPIIVGDGPRYELVGDARYGSARPGDLRISSHSLTPLARWIDDSLDRLESCWSKERPKKSPL